jgi:phage terminase large subunit-like protein
VQGPSKEPVLTEKQVEAVELLGGPATNTLLFGGSRSGKTFLLVRCLVIRALRCANSTHAIVRKHLKDCRQKIGITTFPEMMRLCFPGIGYNINKTDWYITLPNGSTIWLCGLDEMGDQADRILGLEFSTIYYNECHEITYDAHNTAKTRLAEKNELVNRAYFDCNPPRKKHWLYKLFIEKLNPEQNTPLNEPDDYASLQINPEHNLANIDPGYLKILKAMPKRKRERFLKGEWLEDEQGILFQQDWIDNYRVHSLPETLKRIVVGVDPAFTSHAKSDATGIITGAKGAFTFDDGRVEENHYYIFHDASQERATPAQWAKAAVDEFYAFDADALIAEVNQGGDLVESNIQSQDPYIKVKKVHAKRGKYTRAEPIAGLYELGLVHHVGLMEILEDEMTSYNPDASKRSPDRMDALVYALIELSGKSMIRPRVAGIPQQEERKPTEELSSAEIAETEVFWS